MLELWQAYQNYIYIALAVLGALLIILLMVKLFSRSVKGRKGSRLGISEYYEVDKARRLVLIRRDNVEHLLLIGGDQDLVVESSIGEAPAAAAPAPMTYQSEPVISPHGQQAEVMQGETRGPVIRPMARPVFAARRPALRPIEPGDPGSGT